MTTHELYKRYQRHMSSWGIPAVYVVAAAVTSTTFPRFESRLFPGLVSELSVSAAVAIYSSIASGMIALTAIVFSLAFVMVQFSATAYSPRLVLWIARDPVVSHSLGVFTATFLYGLGSISGVDRTGSGKVPAISVWVEFALLMASVGMFVVLIQRIGLLQINRMLAFIGDQGRAVITTIYPPLKLAIATTGKGEFRTSPPIQTLLYRGRPRSVQAVQVTSLTNLARAFGGVIEMAVAVGDTVVESMPLLRVFGGQIIGERKLRDGVDLGDGRTFEQDPKYAIRLLVDIAIKALSPAINDPTTAVQALDQIEDLLLRLGQRHLEVGTFRDSDGNLRLVVPFPTWDDLLRLAFDEICSYGATSVQVMRRLNALVTDLTTAVPEERRPAVRHWHARWNPASPVRFRMPKRDCKP
jgi:uncharacterized membrane protein